MPALTAHEPREEIEESLRGVGRHFLLRCGACAALWWEHSAEAKDRLEGYLSDKGIEVRGNQIVFCPCIPYGLQARMLGTIFGGISAPFSWLMNLYGH